MYKYYISGGEYEISYVLYIYHKNKFSKDEFKKMVQSAYEKAVEELSYNEEYPFNCSTFYEFDNIVTEDVFREQLEKLGFVYVASETGVTDIDIDDNYGRLNLKKCNVDNCPYLQFEHNRKRCEFTREKLGW